MKLTLLNTRSQSYCARFISARSFKEKKLPLLQSNQFPMDTIQSCLSFLFLIKYPFHPGRVNNGQPILLTTLKKMLGKIWTNPVIGLFSTNSWVKCLTNLLCQNQPNRWVCPYFTQCWVVLNPAVLECMLNLFRVLIHVCLPLQFFFIKMHKLARTTFI